MLNAVFISFLLVDKIISYPTIYKEKMIMFLIVFRSFIWLIFFLFCFSLCTASFSVFISQRKRYPWRWQFPVKGLALLKAKSNPSFSNWVYGPWYYINRDCFMASDPRSVTTFRWWCDGSGRLWSLACVYIPASNPRMASSCQKVREGRKVKELMTSCHSRAFTVASSTWT